MKRKELTFCDDFKLKKNRWSLGVCKIIQPFNLFTTIHDGNFRRHSSMNVTIK